MSDPDPAQRWIFRGRVQGVGFRYTALHLSRRHPVRGFVRNLRDGSVELVACADASVLLRFLGDIQQALGKNIQEHTSEPWRDAADFPDFRIQPDG